MTRSRWLVISSGMALALCGIVPIASLVSRAFADTPTPTVNINTSAVQPRQLEDATVQSIERVYAKAWTDLDHALSNNNASALNGSFVGFARDRYTQQVQQQLKAGMSVHLVPHTHNAKAVFYGIEGSSMEVHDDVQLEKQILDGGKVISSETKTVPFVAILTVVDDGWKVRILDEAQP
jgi:hypothetical protein